MSKVVNIRALKIFVISSFAAPWSQVVLTANIRNFGHIGFSKIAITYMNYFIFSHNGKIILIFGGTEFYRFHIDIINVN